MIVLLHNSYVGAIMLSGWGHWYIHIHCMVQALQGGGPMVEQHEETLELLEGTNPKPDWQVSLFTSRSCAT